MLVLFQLNFSVTFTCTGCQITANVALQFNIGGVAQAIQLTIQTPAFATSNGESITEMTHTSRYSITSFCLSVKIDVYCTIFCNCVGFIHSVVFAANASQVFSGVAAFSLLYFPASLTSDAGVAYASSLMRIVCTVLMPWFLVGFFYLS